MTNSSFNMTPGVTHVSHQIYHLHMTIFWICVVIGCIVFSVLIYSLIMHRRSRGHEAADFHESTAIEIIWTVIPFIILIAMAVPATQVLKKMEDTKDAALDIKVTGYQWRWQYEYLGDNVSYFSNIATSQDQIRNIDSKDETYLRTVDHPLVVPIHKKIRFLFTANDVIHSWWVPVLGWKKDAIPGFINEAWAVIDEPGIYHGQCAELCGVNHAYMPIVVEAKSEQEFADWLAKQKTATPNATQQGAHS